MNILNGILSDGTILKKIVKLLVPVLWFRIYMFLPPRSGSVITCTDPDLIICTDPDLDPDTFIITQKNKKNFYLRLLYDFISLKNDGNVK